MATSFLDPAKYPHGTRARYVAAKCRCRLCRGANRTYAHLRRLAVVAGASSVTPSGPPGLKLFTKRTRWGQKKEFRFKTCPGANGERCVTGGAWLKNGTPVCSRCVELATVWNGLVSADRAREHVLALRAKGIGYKAVAAAADIGHTSISLILGGEHTKIRRDTERRILAVDEGARADHSVIEGEGLVRNIEWLQGEGFTLRELGQLLKYASPTAVNVLLSHARRTGKVLAITAARVERLCNLVAAGDVHPRLKPVVPAWETRRKIFKLLKEGFSKKELARRTGYHCASLRTRNVRRTTAEKIAALYDEVMAGARPNKRASVEAGTYEIRKLLDPSAEAPEELRDREIAAAERERIQRRMLAAYADGVSMEDLAERFGVDAAVIGRLARRAGVKHGEAAA